MRRKLEVGGLVALAVLFAAIGAIGLRPSERVGAVSQPAGAWLLPSGVDSLAAITVVPDSALAGDHNSPLTVQQGDFGILVEGYAARRPLPFDGNVVISSILDRAINGDIMSRTAALTITGGNVILPSEVGWNVIPITLDGIVLVLVDNGKLGPPGVFSTLGDCSNPCLSVAIGSVEMVTNPGGVLAGTERGFGFTIDSRFVDNGKLWTSVSTAIRGPTVRSADSIDASRTTLDPADDPLVNNQIADNNGSDTPKRSGGDAGLTEGPGSWTLLVIGGIALALVGLASLKLARR